MLHALLALLPSTEAAGFHFLKAEVVGGVAGAVPEIGVGASLMSDALAGFVTFGAPETGREAGRTGSIVRAWRIASSFDGPVLGVVPPAFRALVSPEDVPFAVPWVSAQLGGDYASGRIVGAEVAGHYVLNVPGFWSVDPRRAILGPVAGIGVEADWWDGWRGAEAVVMTGKITGRAGLAAGVTVRDTWYAQARAVGALDLFGVHQTNLAVSGTTGVFLDRVGVPVGFEVRGELDQGTDTVDTRPGLRWAARAAVYWKLVPPYQTRIEENIERRRQGG